ncbi:hypothetical protein AGOR_G00163830 [Albula goreensis]|uniref:Inhibitory synaptic factor 1 n=1 Tax=Albula goreensis TaxID=1534307 RepID=A0A8T3CZC4_9TELE|nr:hypothetical protein AGOR_G00163830 [Albula goreensis]
MSLSRTAARDTTAETPSQRERIRSHMKMVIDQLEGILMELKDVAKELREVVGQIDKLTSDFDFDLEPDDWTVATASSTSSSERGLGEAFRLDFLNPDVLSDSWEFCSFLESSSSAPSPAPPTAPKPEERDCATAPMVTPKAAATVTPKAAPTVTPKATPTVTAKATSMVTPEAQPTVTSVATATAYSQMNGGLPIPNGPLIVTPDSSSEEAASSSHSHKTSRTSGTRERVRFSDKILYHALCCDDDDEEEEAEEVEGEEEEEEEEEGEEEEGRGTPETDSELSPPIASPTATPKPVAPTAPTLSSGHSLHNCLDSSPLPSSLRAGGGGSGHPTTLATPARKGLLVPGCRKKLLRNSSTQTVSDKSTQTLLPYIPAKQKAKDLH